MVVLTTILTKINLDYNKLYIIKVKGKNNMTHEDAGHYAMKHNNQKIDEKITDLLKEKSEKGKT